MSPVQDLPWPTIPPYALVHTQYTIPPALLLAVLLKPLFTRTDVYRLLLLIAIAVAYTTPWDSYLIYSRVWTYPSAAVLGLAPLGIPVEESFFFVVQTCITSLLYVLFAKATVGPAVLARSMQCGRSIRWTGVGVFSSLFVAGIYMVFHETTCYFYMGLILAWSMPVITILW